jgi:hypothetical protein
MTFSRKKSQNSVFVSALFTLSLLLLSSCSSDVKDSNAASGNELFEIQGMTATDGGAKAANKNWPDVIDERRINLVACLMHNIIQVQVAAQPFEITHLSKTITRTSTNSGCVGWPVDIKFNFLEDECFVPVEGKIRGTGSVKGEATYRVLVNPWTGATLDKNPSLKQEGVEICTQASSEIQPLTAKQTPVIVSSISSAEYRHFPGNLKTNIKARIEVRPLINRKSLNKAEVPVALRGGKFSVTTFLISRNNRTDTRTILAEDNTEASVLPDGRLSYPVELTLQQFNRNDRFELGVVLDPIEAPAGITRGESLAPFEFSNGSTGAAVISTHSLFDRSQFLREREEDEKLNSGDGKEATPPQLHGFVIERVFAERGPELGSNQRDTFARMVTANARIVLVNALTGQSILDEAFEVTVTDAQKKILYKNVFNTLDQQDSSSNARGILDFIFEVPFRQFGSSRHAFRDWGVYTISVKGLNTFKDIVRERTVFINPWVGGNFLIDSSVGPKPKIDTSTRPRIFFPQMSYRFLGVNNQSLFLNSSLDLHFNRVYQVDIPHATVLSPHGLSNDGDAEQRLNTGRFKVALYLLAPKSSDVAFTQNLSTELNLENFYLISGGSAVVSAQNGWIGANVPMPFRDSDVLLSSFRNLLIVEVSPATANSGLTPAYFASVVNGFNENSTLNISLESRRELSEASKRTISTRLTNDLRILANRSKAVPANTKNAAQRIDDYKRLLAQQNITVQTFNANTNKIVSERLSTNFLDYSNQARTQFGINTHAQADFDNFLNNGKLNPALKNDLCHLLYKRDQRYTSGPLRSRVHIGVEFKYCLEDFDSYVNVNRMHFVERVVRQPRSLNFDAGSINRSKGNFVMDMKSSSFTTGERGGNVDYFSQGVSIGSGVSVGAGVTAGANYDRSEKYGFEHVKFEMVSQSEDKMLGARTWAGVDFTLDFERLAFGFEASVRSCLLVQGKYVNSEKLATDYKLYDSKTSPYEAATLGRARIVKDRFPITSSRRFYICFNKPNLDVVGFNQSHFLLRSRSSSNGDNFSSDGKVAFMIRGAKSFEQFAENFKDEDLNFVMIKQRIQNEAQLIQNQLRNPSLLQDPKDRLDNQVPGLIVR